MQFIGRKKWVVFKNVSLIGTVNLMAQKFNSKDF